MSNKIDFTTFKATLSDIGLRFPHLADDDLFALWFLRALVTEDEDEAEKALVGGSNDKNVDAIFVDDNTRTVSIVQTKYRQSLGKSAEKLNDVTGFADVLCQITTPSESVFKSFLKKLDPVVATRVEVARERIVRRDYRPSLYFATLGTVSDTVRESAAQRIKQAKRRAAFEVFDHSRAIILLRDYLDGVAPPIPALDLEMEKRPNVIVNGVSQRYDNENDVESWVFSMSGDAVAQLYAHAGIRLFARNIRGFLGKNTPVNRDMLRTLEREPERFFYYNNGITILCDEAKKDSQKGKDILHVSNPQVINGQQTTRTLAEHPKLAAKATVLVKVIQVSRTHEDTSRFDGLVSRIVAGTNWQNQIRPSDLMTNDRTQIAIERELRKLGYVYIRRRQTKGETRRTHGKKKNKLMILKGQLAQIVAACDIDPRESRSGREKLFGEQTYPKVFPNSDPLYYLSRYWVMTRVRIGVNRDPVLREARWVVLHATWDWLKGTLKTENKRRGIIQSLEQGGGQVGELLDASIGRLCKVLKRYYSANKGTGIDRQPPATFFKGPGGKGKPFLAFLEADAETSLYLERQAERIEKALA